MGLLDAPALTPKQGDTRYPPRIVTSRLIRNMATGDVMASPPTLTATAAQPAAMTKVRQLPNYQFDPWPGFRVSGGQVASTRIPAGINSGGYGVAPGFPMVIEFDYEGSGFAMLLQAKTTSAITIWVNEQRHAATATQLSTISGVSGTGSQYFTVAFGARITGRIRLEIVSQPNQVIPFSGLYTSPTDGVFPPSITTSRLFVIGDSYGYGVGCDPVAGSACLDTSQAYPYQLGRLLGFADVWNWACIPSTGITIGAAGGPPNGGSNYNGRLGVCLPYLRAGDVLIYQGTINDGATASQVGAQFATDIAYLRAALPNTLIVTTSPLYVATPTSPHLDAYTAMKTAASANNVPILDVMDRAVSHFTGTGNAGATTGDGNADYYRVNEGASPAQHPNPAGHRALARALAPQLGAVIAATR